MNIAHRRTLMVVVSTIAVLIAGCTVAIFENPTIAPTEAKPVSQMYGAWEIVPTKPDEKPGFAMMHIGPHGRKAPAGVMRFLFVVHQNNNKRKPFDFNASVGFAEKIGRYHIVHLAAEDAEEHDDDVRIQKWRDDFKGYMIFRVLTSDNELEVTMADWDFIESQIEQKKIAGRLSKSAPQPMPKGEVQQNELKNEEDSDRDSHTVVTATSAEVREFLASNIDNKNLFVEPLMTLRRIK